MGAIDWQYLDTPWSGSQHMTAALRRQGWRVNRKRTQRLTRMMSLAAISPRPHTS